MFQAVILAEKCSFYMLLQLAEKSALNFLNPAKTQKNYGLGN